MHVTLQLPVLLPQVEPDYAAQALQHAAAAAAASCSSYALSPAADEQQQQQPRQPHLHAAALVALGRSHMQQAHAALLAACPENGSDSFAVEASWLPWPGALSECRQQAFTAATAPEALRDEACTAAAATGSSRPLSAAAVPAVAAAITGLRPGSPAAGAASSDGAAASKPASQDPCDVRLPAAAQEPLHLAVQALEQALSVALHCQQLKTAQEASLALAGCYGRLQPAKAALCLAVSQSCASAAALRASFEAATGDAGHAEVLLWRQLQQLGALQGAAPGASNLEAQVSQGHS
jgi:hypothetical protein